MTRTADTTPPPPASARMLYRLPDLATMLGVSITWIYDRRRAGEFPAPVRLPGGRSVAWRREDIEVWLDSLPCGEAEA